MKRYVAALVFNSEFSLVALIRKARPEWQRGRLNGVGGKVEPGETPEVAVVREWREEVGTDAPPLTAFAITSGAEECMPGAPGQGEPWEVHWFYGVASSIHLRDIHMHYRNGETVEVRRVDTLATACTVNHLQALVFSAIAVARECQPFALRAWAPPCSSEVPRG